MTDKKIAKKKDNTSKNGHIEESVFEIISQATNRGASDIHLEPRSDYLLIRFRIDGLLKEANRLPKNLEAEINSYIKRLAGLKENSSNIFQSDVFSLDHLNEPYIFKVSCLPYVEGEKLVISISNEEPSFSRLSDLGLWGDALRKIEHSLAVNKGLSLVNGPSKSGRSTLSLMMLRLLNSPSLNLTSIEEVVENKVNGINQIEIGLNPKLKTDEVLKAALSQDVNIIYVQEIITLETLDLILEAAAKGIKVFSGFSAKSLQELSHKFSTLGANQNQLVNELNLVTNQRLVRKLCLNCRQEFKPSSAYLDKLMKRIGLTSLPLKNIHELENIAYKEGLGSDLTDSSSSKNGIHRIFRASKDGCDDCSFNGYKNRTGLFDAETEQEKLKSVFLGTNEKNSPRDNGLAVDGLIKALRGITSVDELLRSLL